jgi:hypothetical protein
MLGQPDATGNNDWPKRATAAGPTFGSCNLTRREYVKAVTPLVISRLDLAYLLFLHLVFVCPSVDPKPIAQPFLSATPTYVNTAAQLTTTPLSSTQYHRSTWPSASDSKVAAARRNNQHSVLLAIHLAVRLPPTTFSEPTQAQARPAALGYSAEAQMQAHPTSSAAPLILLQPSPRVAVFSAKHLPQARRQHHPRSVAA